MQEMTEKVASVRFKNLTIDTLRAFDFHSQEYRSLVEKSNVTAFQSAEWLSQFYGTLVPNFGFEPVIVTVHDDVDKLIALLPMVRQTKLGVRLLQPADLGITDYNQVVASSETLMALAGEKAFQADLRNALKPFDILLFRKQHENAFDVSSLLEGSESSPNDNSAYYFMMDEDFEIWKQRTLSKPTRKGLSRKRRNIEVDHPSVRYEVLQTPSDITRAFEYMRNKRAERFEDDLLARDGYFEFYLNLAIRHAADGFTQVFTCVIDDKFVTIDFCLRYRGRQYFLLSAFNEAYGRYSPGMLSLLELMGNAKAEGVSYFDLTIGDEDYKSSFKAEQVDLHNVIVPNGPLGLLCKAAYQNKGHMREILKKVSPNIR